MTSRIGNVIAVSPPKKAARGLAYLVVEKLYLSKSRSEVFQIRGDRVFIRILSLPTKLTAL